MVQTVDLSSQLRGLHLIDELQCSRTEGLLAIKVVQDNSLDQIADAVSEAAAVCWLFPCSDFP